MRFTTGELTFTAEVAQVDQVISPQTGAPLRVLTIKFRARNDEVHEQAAEAAGADRLGGLFSLSDAGEVDGEWRVLDSTFAYLGNAPWGVNHHTWSIQQVERLACTQLTIGTVTLEPEEYREETDGAGRVRLATRVHTSRASLEMLAQLSATRAAVDVVREGVTHEPRQMVVDRYVWSEDGDGVGVALVCADVGEPKPTSLLDGPDPFPASDGAAAEDSVESVKAMLRLLVEKGLFGDAEVERVLDASRDRAWQRHLASRQVADAGDWPL